MIPKIVVFDVLGPMYHYNENGWTQGAAEGLLALLEEKGITFSTDNEVAQAEEDLQRGGITPYIMPGFVETALYLREHQVKPVVVSAGTPWVLEHTLELAARDYSTRTGMPVNPEQLVDQVDLISTVSLGSKKSPETWSKAVQKYGNTQTLAVYEDTFANLTAAVQGLKPQEGYHVTSTRSGLTQVCLDPLPIYRGHMQEIGQRLQKIISGD